MKKLLSIILFSFSLLWADVTSGLVAHYAFDGDASDSSGNGHHATLNGITPFVATETGQALDLTYNGLETDTNKGYASASIPITASFTATIRAKSKDALWNANADLNLLSTRDGNGFWIGPDDASSNVIFGVSGNNVHTLTVADVTVYHTYTLTFDDTTDEYVVYLDGVQQASGTIALSRIDSTIPIFMGYDNLVTYRYLNGDIDDVRIYNRVLSPSDVAELESTFVPTPTLKAHGGIIQIDAQTWAEEYIQLPTLPLNYSTGITIESWVFNSSLDNFERIVSLGDGVNEIALAYDNVDGKLGVYNASDALLITDSTAKLNQWNHISATVSSTGEVKLYVNGILENIGNFTTLTNSFSINTLGKSPMSGDTTVKLSIDEVRIWNTVRTQAEIQSTMNSQLLGNETGLTAYYNFDERIGDTVYDISTNGNDGTISGNATRVNFLGNGLEFDGVNSYVDGGTQSTLAIVGDLTMSAWVKPKTLPTDYDLLFSHYGVGETEATNSLYLAYIKADGGIQFGHESGAGVNDFYWTGPNLIKTNVYQYVTITRSVSNKEYYVYVDGELKFTQPYVNNPTGGSPGYFTIGGQIDASILYAYDGEMSEVSIWDRVLTQTEIKTLMASSPNTTDTNLIGYWPLHEGAGTTAYDYSNSTTNGTIVGNATWVDTAPTIYGTNIYTTQEINTPIYPINMDTPYISNISTGITYSGLTINSTAPSGTITLSDMSNNTLTLGMITYSTTTNTPPTLSNTMIDLGNVTVGDVFTLDETMLLSMLGATDSDNDTLTISSITPYGNGTLTATGNGTWDYQTGAADAGSDVTFEIVVSDGLSVANGTAVLSVEYEIVTPVTFPSTTSYSGFVAGEYNLFIFTLSNTTDVALYTVSGSDTYGELYGEDGVTLLASNDDYDDSNFKILSTLNAGSYILKVKGYNNNAVGSYDLVIDYNTAGNVSTNSFESLIGESNSDAYGAIASSNTLPIGFKFFLLDAGYVILNEIVDASTLYVDENYPMNMGINDIITSINNNTIVLDYGVSIRIDIDNPINNAMLSDIVGFTFSNMASAGYRVIETNGVWYEEWLAFNEAAITEIMANQVTTSMISRTTPGVYADYLAYAADGSLFGALDETITITQYDTNYNFISEYAYSPANYPHIRDMQVSGDYLYVSKSVTDYSTLYEIHIDVFDVNNISSGPIASLPIPLTDSMMSGGGKFALVGNTIALTGGYYDNKIWMIDVSTPTSPTLLTTTSLPEGYPTVVEFHEDGNVLAVSSYNNLYIYDVQSGGTLNLANTLTGYAGGRDIIPIFVGGKLIVTHEHFTDEFNYGYYLDFYADIYGQSFLAEQRFDYISFPIFQGSSDGAWLFMNYRNDENSSNDLVTFDMNNLSVYDTNINTTYSERGVDMALSPLGSKILVATMGGVEEYSFSGLSGSSSNYNYYSSAISAPYNNDNWFDGSTYPITWDTGLITGDQVSIYMLSGGADSNSDYSTASSAILGNIATNITNTGSFYYDPQTQWNGTYKILVVDNLGNWDMSDGMFNINYSSSNYYIYTQTNEPVVFDVTNGGTSVTFGIGGYDGSSNYSLTGHNITLSTNSTYASAVFNDASSSVTVTSTGTSGISKLYIYEDGVQHHETPLVFIDTSSISNLMTDSGTYNTGTLATFTLTASSLVTFTQTTNNGSGDIVLINSNNFNNSIYQHVDSYSETSTLLSAGTYYLYSTNPSGDSVTISSASYTIDGTLDFSTLDATSQNSVSATFTKPSGRDYLIYQVNNSSTSYYYNTTITSSDTSSNSNIYLRSYRSTLESLYSSSLSYNDYSTNDIYFADTTGYLLVKFNGDDTVVDLEFSYGGSQGGSSDFVDFTYAGTITQADIANKDLIAYLYSPEGMKLLLKYSFSDTTVDITPIAGEGPSTITGLGYTITDGVLVFDYSSNYGITNHVLVENSTMAEGLYFGIAFSLDTANKTASGFPTKILYLGVADATVEASLLDSFNSDTLVYDFDGNTTTPTEPTYAFSSTMNAYDIDTNSSTVTLHKVIPSLNKIIEVKKTFSSAGVLTTTTNVYNYTSSASDTLTFTDSFGTSYTIVYKGDVSASELAAMYGISLSSGAAGYSLLINNTANISLNEIAKNDIVTKTLPIALNATVTKSLINGWNYLSMTGANEICDANFQTIVSSCDSNYTIQSIFATSSAVDYILKYDNNWRYWTSSLTKSVTGASMKFMNLSPNDGLLIKTTATTSMTIPYNESNTLSLNLNSGWNLISSPEILEMSELKTKVSAKGKTLQYVYLTRGANNYLYEVGVSNPNTTYSGAVENLEYVFGGESFWVYVK